jgi:hypothetical protein
MALYEITAESLNKIEETSFDLAGVRERFDLQRLLRSQIDVIAPNTLVVAEEFGDWEESKRRVDLLALDRDANLVVIELKRTDDGGHMELQAVRYAAMVSTMTFDQVVDTYQRYLTKHGKPENARLAILDFLKWDEPQKDSFAQDVKILLASANFSKELTTAVMWLNDRELDIRCIRVIPYQDNGRVLIDVQQVIPLPEASQYQIQIREKNLEGRKERTERDGLRLRFWEGLLALAERRTKLHANISPTEYHWIGAGAGVGGLGYNYVIRQHGGTVELFIGRKDSTINKKIFEELFKHKLEIEHAFEGALSWERLDENLGSKIAYYLEEGGYQDNEEEWPRIQASMVDAMVRLEKAMTPFLSNIRTFI